MLQITKQFISGFFTFNALCAMAQWSSTPISFPGAERDGASVFSINGKAYITGGTFSSDCREYNPVNKSWNEMNPIPDGKQISFAANVVHNGIGYMICGDTAFGESVNTCLAFDASNNQWSSKTAFPGGKRIGMVAWVCSNRIFVGGGADYVNSSGVGPCHNDLYEYFPQADTWSYAGTMPASLASASVFVVRDTCYLVLGMSNNTTYPKNCWRFNLSDKSWTPRATFPGDGRSGGVAFTLQNTGIAGMGQTTFSDNYQDMYAYNPDTDKWTQIGDYPDSRSAWSAAVVIGSKAYVGTGLELATFEFGKVFYELSADKLSVKNISTNISGTVYPNPCHDVIHIDQDFGTVTGIYDSYGKNVYQLLTMEDNNTINTENLAPGIYLLYSDKQQCLRVQKQ